MRTDYDVLIVGAGPAGCAAAYDLATAGRRVLIVDRFAFPRMKACAGGLTIKTILALRFSIAPVVRTICSDLKVGLRDATPRKIRGKSPLCAMTVRAELDEFVLRETRRRGAEFAQIGRIRSITTDRNRVELVTETGSITARFLIGADGANSTVARVTGEFPEATASFAMEGHIPIAGNRDLELNFDVVPFGYGWVFPKGDHLNVGIYTSRPGKGIVTLERLREYARLKAGAGDLSHVVGHPIGLGGAAYRPRSPRIFLVGDAAGMVDSLFGEGIYYAVVSGQAAAAAIIEGTRYERRLRRIQRDLRACRNSAQLFYGDPDRWYSLLTSAIGRYALTRGVAAGRTTGSILKRPYTVPFSRPPKELPLALL